jgi:hypothetical protein
VCVCVCVTERERERERQSVCVCVFARARAFKTHLHVIFIDDNMNNTLAQHIKILVCCNCIGVLVYTPVCILTVETQQLLCFDGKYTHRCIN